MGENEYAISLKTNRLVKKSTSNYKKLKKLNLVKEIGDQQPPEVEPVIEPPKVEPEPVRVVEQEDTYSEEKLQRLLSEKSTDIIQQNLDKFSNTAKLSDDQLDDLVKKLLKRFILT